MTTPPTKTLPEYTVEELKDLLIRAYRLHDQSLQVNQGALNDIRVINKELDEREKKEKENTVEAIHAD